MQPYCTYLEKNFGIFQPGPCFPVCVSGGTAILKIGPLLREANAAGSQETS